MKPKGIQGNKGNYPEKDSILLGTQNASIQIHFEKIQIHFEKIQIWKRELLDLDPFNRVWICIFRSFDLIFPTTASSIFARYLKGNLKSGGRSQQQSTL